MKEVKINTHSYQKPGPLMIRWKSIKRRLSSFKTPFPSYEEFIELMKKYDIDNDNIDSFNVVILDLNKPVSPDNLYIKKLFLNREYDPKTIRLVSIRLYNMINRCYDPTYESYKHYGARGITICKEWFDPEDYQNNIGKANFIEWCLDNGFRDDLDIDRIDNDKGYSPENCRFVSSHFSASHTRYNDSRCLPTGMDEMKQGQGFRFRSYIEFNGNKNYFTSISAKKVAELRNNLIIENNLDAPLIDLNIFKNDLMDVLGREGVDYYDKIPLTPDSKYFTYSKNNGILEIKLDHLQIPCIVKDHKGMKVYIRYNKDGVICNVLDRINHLDEYNKCVEQAFTSKKIPKEKWEIYLIPKKVIELYYQ